MAYPYLFLLHGHTVLRARLVGVSLVDPVIWTAAAVILAALVLAASIVPARQATRVSLVDTLRAP
jgi:hypothetical protein